MSTHNICFHREIRKILCGYPLLSVAMTSVHKLTANTVRKVYSPESCVYLKECINKNNILHS